MELTKELLIYFLIYSFLGWCIESIFKSFCEKKLVNSGFLYGVMCPIYGFGAIIMYLFLDDISNKPILIFIVGFTVLTVWEYIVGIILEKIFHTKYWDYSHNKFNFQGRICLLNSIFWGLLAVLFIDIVHPFVVQLITKVDSNIILYITIVSYVVLIVDLVCSLINNFSIIDKLNRIEELNNIIKEKLEGIKTKGSIPIQETLEELKSKQEKLIKKMYKTIIRMKRAFPTMKSEQITKFLNDRKKGGNS